MFELLMDFDYQAIRQAMLAAYLLTIVFPVVVMYVSYHSSTYAENQTTGLSQTSIHIFNDKRIIDDRRKTQRFFTIFRLKVMPTDNEDNHSFSVV
ncbi:hypothetical protein CYL18_08665 [Pradoshia eiseniae]|uniref:Uncharacterized protein n=1 Tax=Pradoshia eiseniae TaxID=2064768 RepID=A0A2S7MZU3_9BACI|nr:hypothetical protein [Pradoshia eiseniae]PQD95352.1 hypothetical protein CYL18_08665 [Pradoshia eiseniae]